MSLLHPNEDDDAFAAGHADAGMRMALNRNIRLTRLLREALEVIKTYSDLQPLQLEQAAHRLGVGLIDEIERQLTKTHYDETDDGVWRLDKNCSAEDLPEQRKTPTVTVY